MDFSFETGKVKKLKASSEKEPKKISLLSLDLDGTLLNSRFDIGKRTLAVLEKAQKRGKVFTIF